MGIFSIWRNALNLGSKSKNNTTMQKLNVPSSALKRGVSVDIYLPPQYGKEKNKVYPTVYFNDGQDVARMDMNVMLDSLFSDNKLNETIVVGIYANENRIHEYGTAQQADYKNRGSLARQYSDFVVHELMPFIQTQYKSSKDKSNNFIAGFSLGALSAFDILWSHPDCFSKVGVFSGSLWWRDRPYDILDPEDGRIMHNIVRQSSYVDDLKFWFEVGTNDEDEDRNKNGIIDAIDDTLDLIDTLAKLGYKPHADISYNEIEGGEHTVETWQNIMPQFLQWTQQGIRAEA